MKLSFVDKFWILGALTCVVASLAISMNDIPHYRHSIIHWPFLTLVAGLVVLWLKLLKNSILSRLPKVVLAIPLIALVFFLIFFVVNARYRTKTAFIVKSSAQVAGVVIDASEIRTKGLQANSIGLNIVYRYTVNGQEYVESYGVANTTLNRSSFATGNAVTVRYAISDPSVSDLNIQEALVK